MAQDATVATTGARPWSVVPSLGLSSTHYNVRGEEADPQRLGTELVTQIAPGVLISGRGGRVRGSLDYALVGTVHARRSQLDAITHALTASGQVEAVPGWAYADLKANISQQAASPYGLQPTPGSVSTDPNIREVTTLSISPYLRGPVASWANYELRFSGNTTSVRRTSEGDSTNLVTSLTLQSRPGLKVGWNVLASQQRIDFRAGKTSGIYRLVLGSNYAPEPDLILSLRTGVESTNVGTPLRESSTNWGAGLRWTPSPRTLVSVDLDRRYFGNGHQVVVEHRQRRTAIRFSSARNSTAGSDASGVGSPVTLFQLYMLQYASIEPDATLRELRVRELLRLTNQNPNSLLVGGLATSAVALQRRDDLALSYVGQRSSVTALAFTSSTEAIDRVGNQPATGRVRQVGASLSGSHRLTLLTSINLVGNYQRTLDALPLQPNNSSKSVSLGLSTALSPSTTGSLTARETVFTGQPFPNRETALSGSLNVRF